ncbi:MAG: MFS transporter [Microbacteriaceae bacterium]|nr:MFS transporter [Microbacteriaceae bacterium]
MSSGAPPFDGGPPTTQALRLVSRGLPSLVFGLAVLAYMIAVTQRSSLGVAGVDAADRFAASATALSTLGVMQLAVYAAMQVPVGMLLDRFGATRLILAGAIGMAVGQTVVALAPSLEVAVLGRVLVGAGDATTFVSGLRILAAWFPPRRVPIMQQWFGNLGQIGQFLSAVPFATLLRLTDWTTAFLSTAALSAIVIVAGVAGLRDTPWRRFAGEPVSIGGAFAKLGAALARPGTRLGFWSHFSTQFPGTVFGLLWGFPIMVQGLGIDPRLAAVLVVAPVVAGMLIGPFIGLATARWPLRRSNLVIGVAGLQTACWVACIVWPGQPPLWWFLLTLVVTGAGGTGSNIGFDFARTFNPAASYGSASGIVNIGGFTASSATFLLIGIGVDLVTGGGAPTWEAFRFALWAIPLVTGLGIIGLLAERRRTRSRYAAEEGVVVAPLWTAVMRRIRRRR